jgi:hypothetical protein
MAIHDALKTWTRGWNGALSHFGLTWGLKAEKEIPTKSLHITKAGYGLNTYIKNDWKWSFHPKEIKGLSWKGDALKTALHTLTLLWECWLQDVPWGAWLCFLKLGITRSGMRKRFRQKVIVKKSCVFPTWDTEEGATLTCLRSCPKSCKE